MSSVRCKAAVAAAALWAASAGATAPIDHVDNFALLDQAGKYHDLYYLSDAKAVVLMTHDDECAAVSDALPALEQAKASYAGRGVEFLMINTQDDRDAVAAKAKGSSIPVLLDDTHLVSESLQLTRAGEVLVIDPKGWKIAYRGPLDKAKAGNALLTSALDSVLAGQPVKKAKVAARGCAVKAAKATHAGAKVSYSEQIAPMLIDNCVTCHRTGGIGPWQMTSYDTIKGFAPMIREVVRTKRMPPWHADPHVGVWDGDRSLTLEEKQTLVHWIEAGTPRGKGPDPLADLHKTWSEWAFGKPDMVVEVPAFDIPATGIVDYQRYVVPNTLGRDVWVRATDIIPGDRTVVHHVIVGVYDPKIPDERMRMITRVQPVARRLRAGQRPDAVSAGHGRAGAQGPDLRVPDALHDLGQGGARRDAVRPVLPRLGADVRVQDRRAGESEDQDSAEHEGARRDDRAAVPARRDHLPADAARALPRPRLAVHRDLSGRPRGDCCCRCRSTTSTGRRRTRWRSRSRFRRARRSCTRTVYDNSSQNPANPDPNRTVPWGEQSFDEMLYGVVQFRELTPVSATPVQVSSAGQ